MKIALVSLNDSTDVHEWSGLNYHIARSLENAGATLHRIGPLRAHWTLRMKLRQRWYDATGRTYHAIIEPAALASLGEAARGAIPRDVDVVVAVTSLIAGAVGPLDVPLVSWDDATQAAMERYYPDFTRIADVSSRHGDALGWRAATSVSLAIFASQWAADTAREAYDIPAERVAVVPFGANLLTVPGSEQVRAAISARASDRCELLWVGVDWARKGGAMAVAIATELEAAGIPVRLTIMGCDPPDDAALPDWVVREGFVSKRTPAGEARLAALFSRSHFFVMPSSAEAYGLVYAEASAFGVPSVAIRTGGVPTIVVDGTTGLLAAPGAGARYHAERMIELFRDRARYEAMALAARERSEQLLNWDVAGRSAMKLIESVARNFHARQQAPRA